MRLSGFSSGKFGSAVCVAVLCALAGCLGDASYVVPEGPMPPNTVLLSQMMRELSSTPGFTEAMLKELDKGGKRGPALLTPALVDHLRKLVVGKDWQGLDRFPGWTMREINPAVTVAAKVAGSSQSTKDVAKFIDLGPYAIDKSETVSLDTPSTLPGFTTDGIVSELGAGVVRGDGANAQLAPEHAESQRLADVLNRLVANQLTGDDALFVAQIGRAPQRGKDPSAGFFTGFIENPSTGKMEFRHFGFDAGGFARSPERLIETLIQSGYQITVTDARYFANFGHFHYKGQDVMMPFFVNTQIIVPGTKRPLLVPVSHAEYEWKIRGPKINADVSWYFGIDGKAEFRTMDTQDQAWVLARHAHTYTGDKAVEVTRLVSEMTVAYMHQHLARPELPFGGYYTLGVCQDTVAAIEKKMTGAATLFPNTADASLFDDPRDAEVNALIAAIPKDRDGKRPGPERIFGSLPVTEANLATITIPGLADDLIEVRDAWHDGTLEHQKPWWYYAGMWGGALLLGGFMVWFASWSKKNPRVRK